VLHPVVIVSVWVVISSVSTTGLLSVFSGKHGHFSLDNEVFELHSLDKVSVPDVATVADSDVLHLLSNFVQLVATLLQVVLASEDGSILLHSLLHFKSHLCSWNTSV